MAFAATLDGGIGNDVLADGTSGDADRLLGGDGDDSLYAFDFDNLDTAIGGAGLDDISYDTGDAVTP